MEIQMSDTLKAANRLVEYFSKLGRDEEIEYPAEYDPEEDARTVKAALESA
jgi:predicted HAD superfamily phosphohydrolase